MLCAHCRSVPGTDTSVDLYAGVPAIPEYVYSRNPRRSGRSRSSARGEGAAPEGTVIVSSARRRVHDTKVEVGPRPDAAAVESCAAGPSPAHEGQPHEVWVAAGFAPMTTVPVRAGADRSRRWRASSSSRSHRPGVPVRHGGVRGHDPRRRIIRPGRHRTRRRGPEDGSSTKCRPPGVWRIRLRRRAS
jgi:hypothetical protein